MTFRQIISLLTLLVVCGFFITTATYAQSSKLISEDKVDLLADQVTYDENQQLVIASGNVELAQTGRILRAHKIEYFIEKDMVRAVGDIVLNETTGDVYFAETIQLENQMKDGFISGLRSVLVDGSRFTAEEAKKIGDLKVILDKASYTACEQCKKNPDKEPIWQIKARNVTHHKDEQRISYNDATFEVVGVPIAYTPYFSHPDGSVVRKSGLLTPSAGFDSQLGAFYTQEYYWNIAPSQDATIGAMVMTDANPLVTAEYRKRFERAEIVIDSGLTYNERQDFINGEQVTQQDDIRGHLFADGLWNIDEKWRAGAQLEYVSDDQYLARYNFSTKDVLESKVYAERFDDRHYSLGRLIRFQDIRVSDRAEDQPNILPEVYSRFVGAPNSVFGGRLDFEASALNLAREGSDQDLLRGSSKGGWEKRFITDSTGIVNNLDLNVRGDIYRANDREIATVSNDRSADSNAIRGFANANYSASLPFEKTTENAQIVVEPIWSVVLGTDIKNNDDIPNEDSNDTFLDATNLFNDNRFPGYDRIEDKSHATVGLRTSVHKFNGQKGEVFLGQSYRFDDDDEDNPFPKGSGLSEQKSDFVGAVKIDLGKAARLNYSTRINSEDLSSKRHEVDLQTSFKKMDFNLRYFYANGLQGTDLDNNREQIHASTRYRINDEWSVYSGIQYDLAEDTTGLRHFRYGFDYQGQCVTLGIGGERKLTRDFSGDSGTTILVRLGLKNLGDFETSDISVGGNEE